MTDEGTVEVSQEVNLLSPEAKACMQCKKIKEFSEFSRNITTKDGLQSYCIACRKDNYSSNRDSICNKQRIYNNRSEVRARRKTYTQTPERKAAAIQYTTKYNIANPIKIKAKSSVLAALRKGILTRSCCEVCSESKNVDAHHDDYNKPLEVRWLCRSHHNEWHRIHGSAKNG